MKKKTIKVPREALSPEVVRLYKSGIPLHKALAQVGLDKKYTGK